MSRAHGRPSDYYSGATSRADRSLSVTEASFQNLQLHETAGVHQPNNTSSYPYSQPRRRTLHHRDDLSSSYLQPHYDSNSSNYTRTHSPAPYSGLNSSSLYSTSSPDPQDYPYLSETSLTGRASPYANHLRSEMSFSSYPQGPMSYREPSQYTSRSSSHQSYTTTAEAPPSRSMSGPPGPSILPSSTYGGFRDVEPEVARQRSRNVRNARREHKKSLRRAILPSNQGSGSSQAEFLSGPIDIFAAHSSTSSYGSHSGYSHTPVSSVPGSFGSTLTSGSPYTSTYYPGSSVHPPYSTNSPRGRSSPFPNYSNNGRTSVANPISTEPVVLESPKKPQCWDHGCNGRQFSTFSNLLRHQREKSGSSSKSICPRCGAEFTRKTARDGHVAHEKCKPRGSSRD